MAPSVGTNIWARLHWWRQPHHRFDLDVPALAVLQEKNPDVLRDAYYVDTGEPVGSELGLLQGGSEVEEKEANAIEAARLVMENWRQLTETERETRIAEIMQTRRQLGLSDGSDSDPAYPTPAPEDVESDSSS
ncbi:hypothetical protein [Micromonospora coerulea]|uniref:hypothetical protein n=1 Tax=Micromonospora coerulea TaxID=47856 RepID=UPI001903CE12|nr:hypothetical protein [Micromonospora veneta]